MADRYWVGGAGTWDATTTTNWSDTSGGTGGFSAPTSVDNVIFDSSSNVGNYSVTIGLAATPATCADLSISFPLLGVVTIISAATSVINVHGSLLIQSSTVFTTTSGAVLNFLAITTGKTVLTNNVILGAMTVTFNGIGGNWQLQSAFTTGSTRTTTLTNGTLDLNGYTLTTGLFACGASANTLAFGTGNINLSGVSTIFTGSTATTVTGTPLIILDNNTASARTITPGLVTEANSISFRIISGTGALGLTAGSYRDIDFTDGTNPTGYGGALTNTAITIYGNFKASTSGMTRTAGTQTYTFAATSGTKTITTAAVVFNNPFTFNGVGGSWQLQDALTSGANRTCTLTAGTLNLNNFTLTIGIFSSNNANVRALSFGTLGGGGSLDITSASTTADVTVFNASNSTNFTANRNGIINIIGAPTGFIRSITPGLVSSGGTAANSLNFTILDGSDTINLGTDNHVYNNIEINGFTGSIGANVAPYIYGGFNNQTATITGGANAWVFAGTSFFNSFISNSNINNPVIFDGIGGGWEIYNGFTINAALTLINGTLKIQNGTTLTVDSFVTSGTNQKFLSSTSPGTQATISAASGTNSVSYLTIQDSNATGGAEWDAYTGNFNVNAGNNTGWNFSQFGNKYIYTRRKLKRIIF